MRVTAENYDALKAFWVKVENRLHPQYGELSLEQGNPFKTLEMFEEKSLAIARKSLRSAIGDILEETMYLEIDTIRTLDTELAAANLPTLTAVRLEFSRKIDGIMSRGRVRSEAEFYALRNVVEGMSDTERDKAWAILGAYELKGMKP